MKTDRELLELAAKAAGLQIDQRASFMTWRDSQKLALNNPQGGHTLWNPRDDDGDAMRLAVKLRLLVGQNLASREPMVFAWARERESTAQYESFATDPAAATRRAIVRAAAQLVKKIP